MSRKRNERARDKSDKGSVLSGDESPKITGLVLREKSPAQTFEDYHCSGNLEIDFPELCALLGMRQVPAVKAKRPKPETNAGTLVSGTQIHTLSYSITSNLHITQLITPMGQLYLLKVLGGTAASEESLDEIPRAPFDPKPYLLVELENENPCSAKSIRMFGWKVDKLTVQVLNKILPSLSHLQSLYFWRAGLSDEMVICLKPLCSNLRYVLLEGNPLPEHSYHLLLSEDSNLNHLSLRNNQIGDEGACLIGSALSTTKSANRKLMYLNLAFNSIGDAGAAHIAQGLRLNRSLRFLSLSNNQIGDAGAAHLAKILCPFALTHEEVVERRRGLLERDLLEPLYGDGPTLVISNAVSYVVSAEQSSTHQLLTVSSNTSLSCNVSKRSSKGSYKKRETSKTDEKLTYNPAAKKDDPQLTRKSHDSKAPQGKGAESGAKEKQSVSEEELLVDSVEKLSPLLEPLVQHKDGQIILQGNSTLASLNLAGNRLTEQSLSPFLSSLQMQTEEGGLLRLCLQRNHFSPDCELYIKIQALMMTRDPLNKTTTRQMKEERQRAEC